MFNERVSFARDSTVFSQYNSRSSNNSKYRLSDPDYVSSVDHISPRISIAFQPNINYLDKSENINEIKALRMNFFWFAIIASTNHALNYVVTSYASSLLDPSLAGVVLGLLWTLNAVSGLTVATPACLYWGFKNAMIISLWGYAIQVSTLFIALMVTDSYAQWIIALFGSLIAGFTSAIWWTAQGIYFEYISSEIVTRLTFQPGETLDDGVLPIDQVRADLSAEWTVLYQGADIIVFLSISLFTLSDNITLVGVIGGLSVLGIVTACLGYTFDSIQPIDKQDITMLEIKEAIYAVPTQYKNDARASLLAPFVFGFGVSTAMFAYYFNDKIITNYFSTELLGYLEAYSYLIAILAAYPYAYISNNIKNGQDIIIQFGTICFLTTGILLVALTPPHLGTYALIFIMKGLYGLGRGVFEGSCRAVYASMFTGKDLSTAFSGQTLSAGFSGGICFFIFVYLNRIPIGSIVLGNGIIALITYSILFIVPNRNEIVSWNQLFKILFNKNIKNDNHKNNNNNQQIDINNVVQNVLYDSNTTL